MRWNKVGVISHNQFEAPGVENEAHSNATDKIQVPHASKEEVEETLGKGLPKIDGDKISDLGSKGEGDMSNSNGSSTQTPNNLHSRQRGDIVNPIDGRDDTQGHIESTQESMHNSSARLIRARIHDTSLRGEVSLLVETPKLMDDSEEHVQQRRNTEEDEDMENNMQQISIAGDLSPRHTNSLKCRVQREKSTIPLQVQTRRSKDRAASTLLEPFQDPIELEQYKGRLGMNHALANCSAKIWIFWRDCWEGQLMIESSQQITMKFSTNNRECLIIAVYARCNALERLELWEQIEDIVQGTLLLWVVGGDFDAILNEEEKLGS
ncbi:hypothetical protein KY285_036158 [Solanum tuberosum]|nr:hypothetical protein KY285_036158 [Solanum tuberosum]